jgi:hypothetical protein
MKAGLEKVFVIDLLLAGIDPTNLIFEWRMAEISTTDQFRVSQTQLNRAKTMESWITKYPELANELDVMVREFSGFSDVTKGALSKVKVEKREYKGNEPPTAGTGPVQQPGAGAGPEARRKV